MIYNIKLVLRTPVQKSIFVAIFSLKVHRLRRKEKVYFTSSTIGVDYLTPQLWNGLFYPLNFSKSTSPPQLLDCYSTRWIITVTSGCYSAMVLLFFLFISAKSLKNNSKSQKNHKIKKSNFVRFHISRSIQWTYNMICFSTKFLL
jgi:hypothetical protein